MYLVLLLGNPHCHGFPAPLNIPSKLPGCHVIFLTWALLNTGCHRTSVSDVLFSHYASPNIDFFRYNIFSLYLNLYLKLALSISSLNFIRNSQPKVSKLNSKSFKDDSFGVYLIGIIMIIFHWTETSKYTFFFFIFHVQQNFISCLIVFSV